MPINCFKKIAVSLAMVTLLVSLGCREAPPSAPAKKELLIYCGITMSHAIYDIAKRFEEKEDCIVKIIPGGSGSLYRSILINQAGDLFLPGSAGYIIKGRREKIIRSTVRVGSNQAALIVAKGNPRNISANLRHLLRGDLDIVLGAADSGSIGKETKKILEQAGTYQTAIDRTLFLTSDSKGLTEAIKTGKADLTLNWLATTYWQENSAEIDALRLPEALAPPHQLMLGLLKYARHEQLAKRFMSYASSDEGQEIFTSYGFAQQEGQ